MNKYLVLVCCLATLVSGRPDVSLGYRNIGNYDNGAHVLSTPLVTSSYISPASGDVSLGQAATTSSGSVNILSPGYTVTRFSGGGGSLDTSGLGGIVSTGTGVADFGVGTGFGNGGLTSVTTTDNIQGINGGVGGFGTVAVNNGLTGGVNNGFTGGVNSGYNGGVNNVLITTGGNLATYATQFAHVSPTITKDFYFLNAPEDHDEQQINRYITIGHPQKNYRVVFINAPSSTVTKAKIIAQVAPVEEKTAIYVLSKRNNALDVSADVQGGYVAPSKPDVFYIKYRTAAEALHAQHLVQAQYDRIRGLSHGHTFSIPIQSVIGTLGNTGSSSSTGVHTTAQINPQTVFTSGVAPQINPYNNPLVIGFHGGEGASTTTFQSSPVVPEYTRYTTGNLVPVQTTGFSSGGDSGSTSTTTIQGTQVSPQYNEYTTGNLVPVQTTGFSSGGDSGTVSTTTIHGTSQVIPTGSVNYVSGIVPESSQINEVAENPSNTYIPPSTY